MLMPVRDRGDASAHACIHLRSEDDLAAGVMDAHLLPVGDSMGGRGIRMQDDVGRLAQEAELRVELAPLAPRAVAKRLRLPERRLAGAAPFAPLSEQFRRRPPPSPPRPASGAGRIPAPWPPNTGGPGLHPPIRSKCLSTQGAGNSSGIST